ncbi:MAG TPA: caspase family protein [Pyrinomonadaceae bacterium]|nr:caspase family protein [Pyrinomonadaceae bacterium]
MPPAIYALLIGAEYYFPNVTPEGAMFDSLKGCVRDVKRIEEELLKERLKIPDERILKLHASNHADSPESPPEPPELWPTYDNIVKKFQEVRDMAPPGSQVYIHYSGHGGRTTTKYKEAKGVGGIDETLAPIDIEDMAVSRYLRDIELARLLREMAAKDLLVTLVLDSCHSGGMTRGRGNDVAVRGTDQIDVRVRDRDNEKSLVAPDEKLIESWNGMEAAATRSAKATSGWMPEAKGYVMLAACRDNESAVEYAFNGTDRSGALTYWLLHALQELGPQVSWKQVHDRILGKINSQFVHQTPQVEGDVGRSVLGLEQIPPAYAVKVLQYDSVGRRVELNTGQALGAAKQAGFAIFPTGTTDFTKIDRHLALAEVTDLGASKSWAKVTGGAEGLNLLGGEPAVMIDSGVVMVRGQVRLVEEGPPPPNNERVAALQAVADAIVQNGRGFLTSVGQDEATNYQVAISDTGEYEILDAQGIAFKNIRPAVKINDAGAAEKVVARLRHLYKYHTIEQLKNANIFSPLAGQIIVETFKAPPDAEQFVPPPKGKVLEPLDAPGGMLMVKPGDRVYIHIKNNSQLDLNVAMLDLDSDWSVSQNMPPTQFNKDQMLLESKKDLWPILTMRFPSANYTEGREILKVLATIGPASFRFLELPALDEQVQSLRSVGRQTKGTLEQLMADFNDDTPRRRSAAMEMSASAEWTVAEITLHLRK